MRVLIIRPGALGDTLMFIPCLACLKGKVSVIFVGRQPGLDYIQHFVHRSEDIEGSGWHKLFLKEHDSKDLPVKEAELVVAFFSDKDSLIHKKLTSVFPHSQVFVFPSLPPKAEKIHVALYLCQRLQTAGLNLNPEKVFNQAFKMALIGGIGPTSTRNRIVLHPGSGGLHKNHPPELWLQIIKRLMGVEDFKGLKSVLLLGPAEERYASYYENSLRKTNIRISRCPDHQSLRSIFSRAAIYMGHDSGVTHLAAMTGVPTLAFFKDSDAVQWSPIGPHVSIISNHPLGGGFLEKVIDEARSLICLSGRGTQTPTKSAKQKKQRKRTILSCHD